VDDPTPRHLRERTGKHKCIRCLADIPDDVYFANDQVCDECAEKFDEELTLKDEGGRMKDE
jgi:hypothetical protein